MALRLNRQPGFREDLAGNRRNAQVPDAHGLEQHCTLHCPHCISHVREGPERASERVRRTRQGPSSLEPHHSAGGCWRGAYGAFDGGRLALNVRCRPARNTRGTNRAKDYPDKHDGE